MKNQSRSEGAEFAQGVVDRTYIQLTPDRGNVENPPVERMDWPTYAQAERHIDHPFLEAHMRRAVLPVEYKTATAPGSPTPVAEMVVARQREFAQGTGAPTLGPLTCSQCGFTSDNRKLLKREGDGHTCSTGHYEDDEGQLHRAKNPYAR